MPPAKKPLTAPLYERQTDEGDEAWDAFRRYRDQGPARTHEQVREKLGKGPGYVRQIEEWSSVWSWSARTAAYDKHLDAKRRAAHEAAVVAMSERQAADAVLMQDGLRPLWKALAHVADRSEDELKGMTLADLAEVTKDLTPAMKAAVELERKARGLADLNVNLSGSLALDGLRAAYAARRQRRVEGRDAPGTDEAAQAADGPEPVPAA